MAGIAALGYYVPRFSISAEEYRRATGHFAARGITEKSVPGYDEDEITMAVEAGERALAAGRTRTVGFLAFASSSGPTGSATTAEALGLDEAGAADFRGTTNVGGSALAAAFDFTIAHGDSSLVLVSDAPRAPPTSPGEHPLGGAAVALLIAAKAGVVRTGSASIAREAYGAEAEREATPRLLRDAAERLGKAKYDAVVAPEGDPRVPARAFRGSGAKAIRGGLSARAGDVGAASAFLPFAAVLRTAKRGDRILLVTGGGGAASATAFEVAAKPRGDGDVGKAFDGRVPVTYTRYLGMRRYLPTPPGAEVSQGAYVSLPTYLAEVKARYRLVGERCAKCGRLYFPPRESCDACGGRSWKDVPLRRTGRVYTHTVISRGAAPSEFLEQQTLTGEYATAVVTLDDGPRVTAMLADVDPAKVKIGMRVRMVFRRLYTQEGATRYGFKFAPAVMNSRAR